METHRLEIAFVNTLQIAEVAPPDGVVFFTVRCGPFSIMARGDDMAYTLPTDMTVQMQVSYVDSHGNPASVDGPVTWASSDEAVITATADSADSTICKVTPVGQLGQAQVIATADADLGDGVRSLITTADITVVAGEAVAGTIQPVGQPTPLS